MNVLFLSPNYPLEMQDFTRGLAEVGARVFGLGDTPTDGLTAKVRHALAGYRQVRLFDKADVVEQARRFGVRFDRVECLWEPFVELAAELRETFGVPGMSLEVARGFRDKELMKQRVEAAGLRVPHHGRATAVPQIYEHARRIGFPLILKPIAGAGSADTFRVDDEAQLERAVAATAHVTELSVEEFVDGDEFTFDTVCVGGQPVFYNVAWYRPRPLVARTQEWISPQVVVLNDLRDPRLAAGIELGHRVLQALQMGDGFTHMEWYRKADGEVVFGEIGARVGGAHLVDQMNYSSDIDLYREWARVVCWHAFHAEVTRKYNVAIVFKRAVGEGRIQRIDGLEAFYGRYGEHVCAEALLRPGQHRRNWKMTLVSDGYVMVRHPDLAATLRMADAVGTDVQLHAG